MLDFDLVWLAESASGNRVAVFSALDREQTTLDPTAAVWEFTIDTSDRIVHVERSIQAPPAALVEQGWRSVAAIEYDADRIEMPATADVATGTVFG